jgi:hypothetical protein
MGIVEGQKTEGNGLGCECSGVVKQIGHNVQDLHVGDRIIVCASNTYTTILRTTSDHCTKIPDDLSFEDGATMPCVYGTVIHGLLDLARLEEGQVSPYKDSSTWKPSLIIYKDRVDSFCQWRHWHRSHQHLPHDWCQDLCNRWQPGEGRPSCKHVQYSQGAHLHFKKFELSTWLDA